MSALQKLPLFGYLPHLKLLSLKELPRVSKFTDHSTYDTWRPLEYKERIFRGVESLQTLILTDMNIVSLTKFDLFDLPNLKYIAPERLRPHGFFNDVGYIDKMVRESLNPRLHPHRLNELDPSARTVELYRRPNQAQIDIWCFKIAFSRISEIFNLVQYSNIRNLKIEKPTAHDLPSFPVVTPIRCERIKLLHVFHISPFAFVNVKGLQRLYLEKMQNLKKLPLFGLLPTLKVLSLADMSIQHLTDHSAKATVQSALSLTRIFQGAGLSLQKIVIYRTRIQKITPFDLIDLPRLREIEPERLRPAGFVNGQGAGHQIGALIKGIGFPVPRPIGIVKPRTKPPPHSTVPPHHMPVRMQ